MCGLAGFKFGTQTVHRGDVNWNAIGLLGDLEQFLDRAFEFFELLDCERRQFWFGVMVGHIKTERFLGEVGVRANPTLLRSARWHAETKGKSRN